MANLKQVVRNSFRVHSIPSIQTSLNKASSQQGFAPTGAGGVFNSDHEKKVNRGQNIFAGTDRELWTKENATIDTLYEIIKQSPEVVGIISVLVQDLMADRWAFEGSKTAVKNAKKAELELNFTKALADALWDLIITGDGFIVKLSVDKEDMEKMVSEKLSKFTFKYHKQNDLASEIVDSIPRETKSLQVIKSSTMFGDFDKAGNVKKWHQKINGEPVASWDPEDVIHLSLINIGGANYGFTPLQPLISDIASLIFAKESAGNIFENHGIVPNVWILPEAHGEDDRNYQLLRKQLIEMKKFKNKMRDMVLTGNVEKMKGSETLFKDMMYKELIVHFTNVILFAFGIPAHRVPFVQAKTTVFPKESNEGYYKQIGFMQSILEPQLNSLWAEFKVIMKFNRAYRIDELREANINAILWDRNGMTIEEGREKIGLPREIPKGETMPSNLKGGIFTSFNEDRDERMAEGKTEDMEEDNSPKESRDNKIQ